MAQIAIIPCTAPPALPSAAPAGGEESLFSPHLENAIAKQQPVKDPQSPTAPDATIEVADSRTNLITPSTDQVRNENEPGEEQTGLASLTIAELATLPATQITALLQQLGIQDKDTMPKAALTSGGSSSIITAAALFHQGENTKLVKSSGGYSGLAPDKSIVNSSDTPAFQKMEIHPATENTKPEPPPPKPESPSQPEQRIGVRSQSEALLVRLQEIINRSSETGRVSISKSTAKGPGGNAVTELGQPALTSLSPVVDEGLQILPKPLDQQLPSLRHNVHQQYYLAKVGAETLGGDSTNNTKNSSQKDSQSGDTGAQGSALPQPNSSLSTVDQGATFSQTAALAQESTPQISSETARAILLPSGTIVQEENVVQQFMERFQIARRISESKINIKLHPAELGELKIDLSIKEGSIKANVVAQSLQVQEIIERNIARLRSLLELQGYSLDAVSITTESDSVGDFDLLERQFFSQQDQSSARGHQFRESPGVFDQEISSIDKSTDPRGVNVRV